MAARRVNPRAVKLHRSYSVSELAACLGVHKNTVRHWQRGGLKPIDGGRPVLFQGETVRAFLTARNASRKRPCPPGTLYCFRCREPRPPALGMVDFVSIHFADRIKEAREAVLTVEGTTLTANTQTQTKTFNDFVLTADYAVIDDAYKRAARAISPDLARTYAEHLASEDEETRDEDEALIDAHTTIAAVGLIGNIKNELEAAAEALAKQWLGEFREPIRKLRDERQEVYRVIRELSADPLDVDLARPHSSIQPTTAKEANGTEVLLPCYEKHLLCDGEAKFPIAFDAGWEKTVLETELARQGCEAWYRNPARASQDSLGVVYDNDGEAKIVRPDFIFFARGGGGTVAADIVDPHGWHLADSLPKLKGLSRYAEANGPQYRRIEAIAEIDGRFRMLDLKRIDVREMINKALSAKSVYAGSSGADYTG